MVVSRSSARKNADVRECYYKKKKNNDSQPLADLLNCICVSSRKNALIYYKEIKLNTQATYEIIIRIHIYLFSTPFFFFFKEKCRILQRNAKRDYINKFFKREKPETQFLFPTGHGQMSSVSLHSRSYLKERLLSRNAVSNNDRFKQVTNKDRKSIIS